MKKVILVDGNNLLFRSFFATSYQGVIMKNSKGFPTNALYGFINMINKIINEEKPNYILVAFDKGKTFRHDKYDFYKQGRALMADELRVQFPKAKEVLDAMGIKHFEIDNYEADDIIGTLAKIVDEEDEFIATIISSDKDLLQLISDEVEVKLLKTNNFIRMTRDEFKNTYGGLEPSRMIDIKALMGDSSDNIPGVKGIGEKTAISLLKEFATLENLYNHLDEVKGKTKEKLVIDKNNAFMSYEIATIYKNVPIDFELEDLKYSGVNEEKYVEILKELEFHSLLRKLVAANQTALDFYNEEEQEDKKKEEEKRKELVIKDIKEFKNKNFSYYIEVSGTNYSKGEILGVGLYDGDNGYFIEKEELNSYKELFLSSVEKYTYDLKKNIVVLHNYNMEVESTLVDTMIAAYLLDYEVKDDISFLASKFDYTITTHEDFFGSIKRPRDIEKEDLKKLIIEKAKFIYEVKNKLLNEIKKTEQENLFNNIEMPLTYVLADMELTGIRVEKSHLVKLEEELKINIAEVSERIYLLAGVEFNINSPKQLADILFIKMGLRYPKKIKDNKYSTSIDILTKIKDEHPIISLIIEYRSLTKLYSNYAVGLQAEIREDSRIHTVYTQTLTRTGRLSSISPNLQNIPMRDEYGRSIRKAFLPDEDSVLLSSDYSQVELRVFASMSNEASLIKAFKEGMDIHTKTAADIFKVSPNDVDKTMRRTAKAVNFGILYGISSFGLSEDLNISIKEAKAFMDNYLETYPGINEYMKEEIALARENGYVKTLMNRRRLIPELNNKNYMIKSMGERMALNTPIQGTAADILKKAMVEIYNEFNKRGLKSKMLLQVHDELVINVLKSELDEVKELVKNIMENTYKLKVPLKVEIEVGNDWYEAK